MPTYSARAPNGKTYSLTGPAGATDEQVRAEILRQNPEAGIEPKRPGLVGSFMEAATTIPRMGVQATAFAADPNEENRRALLKAGETKYEPVGGFRKENTLGENIEAAKEIVGGSLGQAAAPTMSALGASALVGPETAGLGALIAAPAAGYATNTTQYTIQNLYRQAQEQQDAVDAGKAPNHAAVGKAFVAATGQAGLDLAGEQIFAPLTRAFPFAKNLIFGKGKAATESAEALEEAITSGALKPTERQGYTGDILKGVGKGIAFEVPQEIAQQAMERWQAGLSLTDTDAQEEYKQAAIGAAFLGPLFGGATGALETRAHNAKASAEETKKPTDANELDNEPPHKGESSYTVPEGVDPAAYAETFARLQERGFDAEDAHDATVQALTPNTYADELTGDSDGVDTGGPAAGLSSDMGVGVGTPTVRGAGETAGPRVEPASTSLADAVDGAGPSDAALSDGEVGIRPTATKKAITAAMPAISREFTATKDDFVENKLTPEQRRAAAEIYTNNTADGPGAAIQQVLTPKPVEPTMVAVAPVEHPIAVEVLPKKVIPDISEVKAFPPIVGGATPAPTPEGTTTPLANPPAKPVETYGEVLDKLAGYQAQGVSNDAIVPLQAMIAGYEGNPKPSMTPEQAGVYVDKKVAAYLKTNEPPITQVAPNVAGEAKKLIPAEIAKNKSIARKLAATRATPTEEAIAPSEEGSTKAPPAEFKNVGPVDPTLVEDVAQLQETIPSISLSREVRKLVKEHQEGNISSDMLAAYVAETSSLAAEQHADRRMAQADRPRVRGADFIRQRLLEAKRRGDLTSEAVDFAEWAIQRNPELVDQLGLTIRQETAGSAGSSGQYFPLSRVMRLVKGSTVNETIVHEIMHHAERMMPADVQDRIRKEWQKRFSAAEKAAKTPNDKGYFQLLRSYHTGINQETGTPLKASDYEPILAAAHNLLSSGRVGYENYQYFNPSEFWAVNATDIMQGRYGVTGSVLNRLHQWVRELITFLTNQGGNRAILRGLEAVLQGEGVERSGDMLSTQSTYLNVSAKPSSAKAKVDASIEAQRAATGNLEAVTKAGLDEGIGATVQEHDPSEFVTQLRDHTDALGINFIKAVNTALPTSALLDWVGAKVPPLARIVELVNRMNAERNNLIAGANKLVKKVDAFVRKYGLEEIASAMHIARLSGVNPMAHADLSTALKNDFVRQKYATLLADPNLNPKSKGGFTRAYNQRAKELADTYTAWEALSKQEGGHELYKEVRQYYKDMYTALRSRLDKNIMAMDISDDSKKNLLAFVRLQKEQGKGSLQAEDYPDVDPKEFPDEYFPFKRFGDNWLNVDPSLDKAKGRQFYMFDSKAAMLAFRRKIAADAGIDVNSPKMKMGFNVEDLQTHMEQNSAMLKDMFAEIEKAFASNQALGQGEKDKLKDALYQVYLMTLPERSIRRQFVHSKNVTGFSADVLRTLKTSASQYSNQLAKLKYASQIDREVESADSVIYDGERPSDEAAKLDIFKAEIASRARDQVDPSERGALTSFLNNASFVMFLTSGATAATQFTGIPIRVMPRLLRLYGVKGTVSAMTKWAALHNSIGVRQKQPDGTTKFVFPSAEFSPLVSGSPILKKAFAAGNDRGIFGAITDSLIQNQATAATPVQNAAQQGLAATYNMLTGMFNAAEKTSREITYMMGFEQEYKKTGDFNAAVRAGAQLVEDTLGNYEGIERPSITTKNDLARLLFLFKMYAINTTKFFVQNTRAMLKGDVGAMVELGGVLSMGALFHGMTGMPIYSLVNATINALNAGDDDEDKRKNFMADDADYRFRHQFMPKYFGQNSFMGHSLDEIGTVGLIPAITGSNIGSRTSFDNMWFREGKPGQNWAETVQNTILANIAGASLAPNLIGAAQDFNAGNITRGLEQMLPGFFKGAATAYRLKTEGAETRGGDQLLDANELTDAQLVGQVIGFQPTKLAEVQQQAYALKKRITAVDTQRRQLMQKLNSELYEEQPDKEKVQKVLDKMVEFNTKYPFPDTQITMDTLDSSWKAYQQKRQYMLRGLAVSKKQAPYVLPDLIKTYEE